MAKKPPKPNPPGGDNPGAACAESVSFFPAFVYSVESEKDSEIYLSNAAGDCSIQIYDANSGIGGYPSRLGFRLFANDDGGYEGRIVFREAELIFSRSSRDAPDQIQILSFTIKDGAIVEDLPISPVPLALAPDVNGVLPGRLFEPDLSPLGDSVVFAGYVELSEADRDWEFFIDEVDIVDGTPSVRRRIFETQPDANGYISIGKPLYSPDGQRVYFTMNHLQKSIVFVEKSADEWPGLGYPDSGNLSSEPTLILAHEDGGSRVGAVGLWEQNGTTREVIAHPRRLLGFDTIEILDVNACVATHPPGGDSCVIVGSRNAESYVIEGVGPTFTNFNKSQPDLLYLSRLTANGGRAVFKMDLDSQEERVVIDPVKSKRNERGILGVDSAE